MFQQITDESDILTTYHLLQKVEEYRFIDAGSSVLDKEERFTSAEEAVESLPEFGLGVVASRLHNSQSSGSGGGGGFGGGLSSHGERRKARNDKVRRDLARNFMWEGTLFKLY